MSNVKFYGSTVESHLILQCLSVAEESGIPGVGVKSVDIGRNTDGEGSFLGYN